MSPLCAIGHADLADLAARELVVGVVAGLRRQVEGDREARSGPWRGCSGTARWTSSRSSGPRRCASSTGGRASRGAARMRRYLRSRHARHRPHAPRPPARHRLLGGRRRARRPGPGVDARHAARRRSAASSSRARSCSPTSTSTTPAPPGALVRALARPARSTCTSAARRTWPTRSGSWPAPRGSTAEDGLQRLWGEVVPVPEANLHVLDGRRDGARGRFRSSTRPATPPTTSATCTSRPGCAFVGDVAGVRIPPADARVAPTPPPDIDVEAWERSLDLIAGWEPAALALTHFGAGRGRRGAPRAPSASALARAGRPRPASTTQEDFVAT